MKKVLLLIAAVVALAACTKTVEVPVEVPVEVEKIVDLLTLNATSIQVSNAGAVQPMSFTTEDAWTIASDADWIAFDKASGNAGSSTVNMTVAKNEAFDSRTGRVTLSTTHNGTTKNTVFTVVQSPVEVFNTTVALGIDFTEQDIEVDFNSNLTPEVAIVDGDWLTITRTKAAPEDGKIVLHAAENADLDARVGVFTVFAGNSLQTYKVVQGTQYTSASNGSAVFLGNKQDMGEKGGAPTREMAQFGVQFETPEGLVTLALNVDPAIEDVTKLPVGEYTLDESSQYVPGTFSLQSTGLHEKYYTTVTANGKDMEVVDGKVTVAENAGKYSIVAELTDIFGVTHLYSYKGDLVATDDSLGARPYQADYRGQYYTYFTTKAEESVFCFQFNKALPGNDVWISYMYFNVFSEPGYTGVPTGKFTYEVPVDNPELDYLNGKTDAHPGTFTVSSPGTPVYEQGISYAIKTDSAPSFEIVKEEEEGCYTLIIDVVITRTEGESSVDIPFKNTFNRVYIGELGDIGVRVIPDGSAVFENGGMNSTTAGQYYGDIYHDGGHIVCGGCQTINTSAYEVYFTLNLGAKALTATSGTISTKYRDELGETPRYCTESIPDGIYSYAEVYDKDALQLLPAFVDGKNGPVSRAHVKNNYSGTVFHIVGGSITFAGGKPIFDLDTVSDKGETAHFTGSYTPSGSRFDFNYQHSSYRNVFHIQPFVVPTE